MTIETASYISQLNVTYPEDAADRLTADDHLRLIKSVVKASFPAVTGAITVTPEELNLLVGNTEMVATTLARLSTTVLTTLVGANILSWQKDTAVSAVAAVTATKLHPITLSVCLSSTSYQVLTTGLPVNMKRLHIHVDNLSTDHGVTTSQSFAVVARTTVTAPNFPGASRCVRSDGCYDTGFYFGMGGLVTFGGPETETAVFTGSIEIQNRNGGALWTMDVDGVSAGGGAPDGIVSGHFINEISVTVERIAFHIPGGSTKFTSGLVRMWVEE